MAHILGGEGQRLLIQRTAKTLRERDATSELEAALPVPDAEPSSGVMPDSPAALAILHTPEPDEGLVDLPKAS